MNDLVERLRKRAEIRRQIPSRNSVQNNEPDRIADLLEEAANRIEELEKCMVKSSGLLFNYKYELELERAMSAQLREELEKYK